MLMPARSPDLQRLLDLTQAAIYPAAPPRTATAIAAERIFSALRQSAGTPGRSESGRLPVCRQHLEPALTQARLQQRAVGDVADAFAALEPRLAWTVRAGAETQGQGFLNGHANATIIGPGGLEIRNDIWIGVTLMAPGTRYPDHSHPPEEIYLVLSEGEWCNGNTPWHRPGIGGLVYNPPNIVHAMRSAEQPLLALWFLWTGTETGA